MSNLLGDNLGVDKNDLSQLKHFGTEFVLVFFFTYRFGFERTTPTRITLSGSETTRQCRAVDLVSLLDFTTTTRQRERKVGLYCSKLAS